MNIDQALKIIEECPLIIDPMDAFLSPTSKASSGEWVESLNIDVEKLNEALNAVFEREDILKIFYWEKAVRNIGRNDPRFKWAYTKLEEKDSERWAKSPYNPKSPNYDPTLE